MYLEVLDEDAAAADHSLFEKNGENIMYDVFIFIFYFLCSDSH